VQVSTASEWVRVVEALGTAFGDMVVVAGAGSTEVAEALRRAGGPPLAVETERLAVLLAGDLEEQPVALVDLPSDGADLVMLRRAWQDRPALPAALREAYRILRSGGRLVAADLDVDRLMTSSSFRYPSRLQYALLPGKVAPPESLSMALSIEVGRAGFRTVRGWEIDEERAVYADAKAYWEAVRDEGWPAFRDLSAEDAERLLEVTAAELGRIAPLGELSDRRPWFVVTGVKP
jgi:SAM-dependent methyltransferase